MDKFTNKVNDYLKEQIDPKTNQPGNAKKDIKNLKAIGQAAEIATALGATPQANAIARAFRQDGQTKLNRAMDRVLKKVATRLKSLEASL